MAYTTVLLDSNTVCIIPSIKWITFLNIIDDKKKTKNNIAFTLSDAPGGSITSQRLSQVADDMNKKYQHNFGLMHSRRTSFLRQRRNARPCLDYATEYTHENAQSEHVNGFTIYQLLD
jgi:hypothetical protein